MRRNGVASFWNYLLPEFSNLICLYPVPLPSTELQGSQCYNID